MILFVDCDDTLILWNDSARQMNQDHTLWMGDKYKPNQPLINAIRKWRGENERDVVVVWSGGGASYAKHWAELFLPNDYEVAMSKDITLPTEFDVCVDDMQIKVKGVLFTPAEFINAVLM